jgi:hypothetical protein
VKAAQRLLRENTASDGSLNSEKACNALLQYRNTPIQHLGLSPAQLLFHRNLRDSMPLDPRSLRPSKLWIEAAKRREEAFQHRNQHMVQRYDRTSRPLSVIPNGTNVIVQDANDRRWRRMGIVVESQNRQYTIRMHDSGRVVTRNRRVLRPLQGSNDVNEADPLLFSQSSFTTSNETTNMSESSPDSTVVSESQPSAPVTNEDSTPAPPNAYVPRMLKRLQPFNQPGLKE